MSNEILISFEIDDNRNPHNNSHEYNEQIETMISFYRNNIMFHYKDETTIFDMLNYICNAAPFNPHGGLDKESLSDRFHVILGNDSKHFGRLDSNLATALKYIGVSDKLKLHITIGYPGGGASVGENEGIRYYIYTNEANHKGKPHVHAEYAEYKASIGILDAHVLCGSLPAKKMKRAQIDVRNNRGFLIRQWNEYNNGFYVPEDGYYCNPDQKKMHFILRG